MGGEERHGGSDGAEEREKEYRALDLWTGGRRCGHYKGSVLITCLFPFISYFLIISVSVPLVVHICYNTITCAELNEEGGENNETRSTAGRDCTGCRVRGEITEVGEGRWRLGRAVEAWGRL